MASNRQEREGNVNGLLMRQEVSHGDHPLSMGKASFWHQYFQVSDVLNNFYPTSGKILRLAWLLMTLLYVW